MFTKSGKSLLNIIVVAMIFSCNNKPKNQDTELFAGYLETSLHSSIPSDSSNYILISEFGCHGCIEGTINKLRDKANVTFILSKAAYHNYMENMQLPANRYRIDSTGEINRLKYHGGNVGIVQTANHAVYNIIPLQTATLDSMINAVLK